MKMERTAPLFSMVPTRASEPYVFGNGTKAGGTGLGLSGVD
jgi:hypothetical protein